MSQFPGAARPGPVQPGDADRGLDLLHQRAGRRHPAGPARRACSSGTPGCCRGGSSPWTARSPSRCRPSTPSRTRPRSWAGCRRGRAGPTARCWSCAAATSATACARTSRSATPPPAPSGAPWSWPPTPTSPTCSRSRGGPSRGRRPACTRRTRALVITSGRRDRDQELVIDADGDPAVADGTLTWRLTIPGHGERTVSIEAIPVNRRRADDAALPARQEDRAGHPGQAAAQVAPPRAPGAHRRPGPGRGARPQHRGSRRAAHLRPRAPRRGRWWRPARPGSWPCSAGTRC